MKLYLYITLLMSLALSNVSFALECESNNYLRDAKKWFSQIYSFEQGAWLETGLGESQQHRPIAARESGPPRNIEMEFNLYPEQWPKQTGSVFNISLRRGGYFTDLFFGNVLALHAEAFKGNKYLESRGRDRTRYSIYLECTLSETLRCKGDLGINLLFSPVSNKGYVTIMATPDLYQWGPPQEVYVQKWLENTPEVSEAHLNAPPRLHIEGFTCD